MNLQMLDANENMSKNDMDLNEWVTEQTRASDRKRFLENHIIPDRSFELRDFEDFIEDRKKILTSKLKTLLN